jgi:predicted N-acyltransferase
MSAPLPSQLRICSSISDVPAHAWNALLDEQSTPFLEHAWLSALEESGSAAPAMGWHPRHLTLWRGNRLVAAAPAYVKDHSFAEFVYDFAWATAAERMGIRYYPKLVLGVLASPATGRRFLVAPGEDRLRRTQELARAAVEYGRSEGFSSIHVLFSTPEETAVLEGLGYATRLGVQYQWHNPGYKSYDDFLDRFKSKRRTQLRRELRAMPEQGVEIRTLRGAEVAAADPDVWYRLYSSTVDKFAWGRRHLTPSFFGRLFQSFHSSVELVVAERKGKLLAGAMNLRGEDALYGRYWGCFDEVPFLHFNVCLYHPVADCIAAQTPRFEPGAGGEHKLVRGFEPTLTYSSHFLYSPILEQAVQRFLVAERAAILEGMPQWALESGLKE